MLNHFELNSNEKEIMSWFDFQIFFYYKYYEFIKDSFNGFKCRCYNENEQITITNDNRI